MWVRSADRKVAALSCEPPSVPHPSTPSASPVTDTADKAALLQDSGFYLSAGMKKAVKQLSSILINVTHLMLACHVISNTEKHGSNKELRNRKAERSVK